MKKIIDSIKNGKSMSIVAATIVLCIVLSFLSPSFLSISNMSNIILQASVTGILAVGMTFVIATSGIDISVGAILFFCGSVFAKMAFSGWNVWLAIIITVTASTIFGALNGFLIVKTKMMPFIVTLVTYNIYRGLALHITGAGNIPVTTDYSFLGTGKIFGVSVPTILFIVILIIGIYLMTMTKFGIYVKAIGNSEKSALETGLPVTAATIGAYGFAGFTAGLGGLILIGRIGGLQSGMGIGMEFTVIAAVVLGGTLLSGGSGNVLGSAIGACFLLLINNGLNLIQASVYAYDIVTGGVLLIAVIIDRMSSVRQTKAMLEQKARRIRGEA